MYLKMNLGSQKALQDAQDYYQYSCNSDFHRKYHKKIEKYLSYRDGEYISPELLADLRSINARYFSTNLIEPEITNLISLQISARKSIDFKVNSNFNRHKQLAYDLKQYMYIFQQQNNYQNQATAKFEDGLVAGVGAAEIKIDPITGAMIYEQFDCRELILDPDDRTLMYNQSNFMGRQYYAHSVALKNMYPKHAGYIDSLVDSNTTASAMLEEAFSFDDDKSPWVLGRSLKVVEVYYKKNSTCYKVLTQLMPDENDIDNDEIIEHYFYTFDKDLANAKKKPGTTPEEIKCTKIFKTVFTNDCLLEHAPLESQVPNQRYFPIVPICIKRDRCGYPYGVVKSLTSLNDSKDYIWSQHLHALNQRTVLISGNNVDTEKAGKKIVDEIRKKYGVIALTAERIELITNEKSLGFTERALQRVDIDRQQITQLYDENKGKETNATSGIGMLERKTASRQMQNKYGAIYDYMLWSEGQLLLDTLKGTKNLNLQFYYAAEGRHIKIDNEIAMLEFQIHQDTDPAFVSSADEKSAKLMDIIKNGAAPVVFGDEYFAENVGLLDKKDATESVKAFQRVVNPAGQQINENENGEL